MKKRRENLYKELGQMLDEISMETGLEVLKFKYLREHGRRILRITINKEGGVNLGDCETFSRALSKKLDEKDVIQERYFLEVESPGI